MFDCSDGKVCGSCGGSCFPCASSFKCTTAAGCQEKVCGSNGECSDPSCSDQVKNGAETLTDCGGGCKCAAGLPYASSTERKSSSCVDGLCAAPTCSDGVQNRQETDIDCGDDNCAPCAAGKTFSIGLNCADKVCGSNGVCQIPSCTDGVKNSDELDTDCSGSAAQCGKCHALQLCNSDADCLSSHCLNNACVAPSCDDARMNGGESDVDCGGSCDTKCALNQLCVSSSDCGNAYECQTFNSNQTCRLKPVIEEESVYTISDAIQAKAISGDLAQGLGFSVSEIDAYARASAPEMSPAHRFSKCQRQGIRSRFPVMAHGPLVHKARRLQGLLRGMYSMWLSDSWLTRPCGSTQLLAEKSFPRVKLQQELLLYKAHHQRLRQCHSLSRHHSCCRSMMCHLLSLPYQDQQLCQQQPRHQELSRK